MAVLAEPNITWTGSAKPQSAAELVVSEAPATVLVVTATVLAQTAVVSGNTSGGTRAYGFVS